MSIARVSVMVSFRRLSIGISICCGCITTVYHTAALIARDAYSYAYIVAAVNVNQSILELVIESTTPDRAKQRESCNKVYSCYMSRNNHHNYKYYDITYYTYNRQSACLYTKLISMMNNHN